MGWAQKIIGYVTGNGVEVDANNQLLVRGAIDPNKTGLYGLAGLIDDGTFTGTPRGKRIQATEGGRLLTAPTLLMWDDTFNATAQSSGKWRFVATTQTGAQAAGLLILNNSGLTTANTDCAMQTRRAFPIFGAHETRCTVTGSIATAFPHVANNTIEFGLFSATLPGQAAPTDGAFFRYNASNELRGVISYNGTETQTAAIAQPSTGNLHDFEIRVQNDAVTFWIDRALRAVITLTTDAPAQGQAFMQATQPLTIRQRIGAAAPGSATKFTVSDTYVTLVGPATYKAFADSQAGMHKMAYEGQDGGTVGSSANYANSANPTAAVPTNTTAALGTGLGGQFWETHSLALGTDGIISSFQNPVGGVNQTPRNLVIYGVMIDSTIQTILAGGPYGISYSLAYGHTAVSLATAESATFTTPSNKAPRRIALGKMAVTAAQAAATRVAGSPVIARFAAPIYVLPGEFVAVVTKHETGGTVGTTGVIAHNVTFDAHFE